MSRNEVPTIEEGSTVQEPRTVSSSIYVPFLQKIIAEIIGTYFLIFAGCMSITVNKINGTITLPGIAITWGLTVMVMIYAVGHISGAHFNPAVTIAFASVQRLPWKQVPAYVAAQLIGAVLASGTLRLLFDGHLDHYSGTIRGTSAPLCSPRLSAAEMASSDNPEVPEIEVKERGHDEDEEKGGFIEKVKDFIHDIGEKIEGAIGFGKPTADVTGIHLPTINLKKVDIVIDVLITNPNPVPIPLIDINYLIDSDGRKLVSGLIPDAGTIHAHGSETVKIPVTLIYDDIKSTYSDIKPGSIIPYKIKVDLLVDVPIFGRLTLPLEKTGEIPVPYKPDIDVEKIRFGKFSFEETVANLHVKLENKNDFDLGLNMLDFEFWLAEVSIGSAELTESTKIEKQGVSRMKIPITFRPKEFGSAMWDMIRGRGMGYSMKGKIDVDTPFGNMKLPISKEGGTTRLKKNREGKDDDDDSDEE